MYFKFFHTFEKRVLSSLWVCVGLDVPDDMPDEDVSERFMNDLSMTSDDEKLCVVEKFLNSFALTGSEIFATYRLRCVLHWRDDFQV